MCVSMKFLMFLMKKRDRYKLAESSCVKAEWDMMRMIQERVVKKERQAQVCGSRKSWKEKKKGDAGKRKTIKVIKECR